MGRYRPNYGGEKWAREEARKEKKAAKIEARRAARKAVQINERFKKK